MISAAKDTRLLYGLHNDELLHISTLSSGFNCDCLCPVCNLPLVAIKGSKSPHHFIHRRKNPDCLKHSESLVHFLAKKVIQSNGYLFVPERDTSGLRKIFLKDIECEKNISN